MSFLKLNREHKPVRVPAKSSAQVLGRCHKDLSITTSVTSKGLV